MKRIVFIWSGATISGFIQSQFPHDILGQKTVIQGDDGITYTMYGKCEEGDCGPYRVLSIS